MLKVFRSLSAIALLAIALIWITSVSPTVSGQASPMPSLKAGDWPMNTADTRGSKYSPLDQINASNFNQLEVAWTFKTDNLGVRPEAKLQGTPIAVRGTLYTTAGTGGKAVVALDGKTGELLWVHRHQEGERASRWSPRPLSGRGVAYWTDGRGDERIVYLTTGYQLVSLNAKTGQYVSSFGRNGVVDLKVGMVVGKDKQIDLEKGEIGQHTPPMIVGDTILVGAAMAEGLGYNYSTNTKGAVRAFDARTGKQLWRFDTIPKPGEFGNDTWKDGSWEWSGNTGAWTQITADPEAGLAYIPVETGTMDQYGGNRPGDNLFAESIVAVDLKTGKRKWHYQLVHHGIWDMDIPAAPLLIDAVIDGQPRKLVAVPTKQGWLYTFDRLTGKPIWDIVERPVPQSDVPGEKTSPTQPFVTKPPPYSRTYLATDDLIDFTPELRAQAIERLKPYRWEQSPFVPPAFTGAGGKWRGSINVGNTLGGVNWPGASFDPETAIFYAQAQNNQITSSSFGDEEIAKIGPEAQAKESPRRPRWEAEPNFGAPRGAGAGTTVGRGGAEGGTTGGAARGEGRGARVGGGRGAREERGERGGRGAAAGAGAPAVATPPAAAAGAAPAETATNTARNAFVIDGLPIIKPPYGLLTAIDMNKGEILFKVPHGETPDAIRAAFQKLGINYPERTGQGGNTGVLVTKTMVVVGDLQVTQPPGRTTPAAMLRAYDKKTGQEIGAVAMPSRVSGSPMTYMVDGRQYINVAVYGIGNGTGTYVTYRLPDPAAGR